MRLVHPRDDATSTSNLLVSGNLFHFELLKRGRSVVLDDVVRGGGFLEKLLSTYCVNHAGKFFGMSPRSWGLAQGLQR